MKVLFVLVVLFATCSCSRYPEGVTESLSRAGDNREELEKVLEHYRQDPDFLKYKAACFLIENMRWHYTIEQVTRIDSLIPRYHERMDSIYDSLVSNHSDEQLSDSLLRATISGWSYKMFKQSQSVKFEEPRLNSMLMSDVQFVSSDFIICHVENAFKVWREELFCKHLTFDEFCEGILPYRSIEPLPFFENGKMLNEVMLKHLRKTNHKKLSGYLKRYHHYVSTMQSLFSMPPLDTPVGFYDLFVGKDVDCISTANNACNILRACGVPLAVNFNMAYKEMQGRHYFCSFLDSTKTWKHFNPQTNCLDTVEPLQGEAMNMMRYTFAAQYDSPYFLKSANEILPIDFQVPCIKDVTRDFYQTASIRVPFGVQTENKIAYLYAFNNNPDGIIPVCWGVIQQGGSEVQFDNAMYNVLYFPIYMEKNVQTPFLSPFYITKDSTRGNGYKMNFFPCDALSRDTGDIVLTRKYPRKQKMIRIAREMIGGRFWGANRADFSDSTLLLTITQEPQPYLQDYELKGDRSFRYYKYSSPVEGQRSNISRLEFLIDSKTRYSYTEPASSLPVMEEGEISRLPDNQRQVVEKDINSFRCQRAYDHNMQTGCYESEVYLNLERPVKISTIRMSPLNAENSIVPGDRYKLMYWENGWKEVGILRAKYNYLKFERVPLNRIYWLRNLDNGTEELPFICKDGKQLFIYHDVVI